MHALRLLADLEATLDSATDAAAIVDALTSHVVPRLADWCIVEVDGRGREPARVRCRGGASQDVVSAVWPRAAQVPGTEHARVGVVTDRWLRNAVPEPEAFERIRALRPRSMAVLPMTAAGRRWGYFTLVRAGDRRPFRAADRVLAEAMARRVANALAAAERADGASRAVRLRDEVLAAVAHDLRSPLHTIVLTVGALAELRPANEWKEPERRALETVRRTADTMNTLIADLLDVATLESGRPPIEVAPHDAAALLRLAEELFSPHATEHSLRLQCRCTAEGALVAVHRERVLQVFANLLGNAVRFTPAGGVLTVAADPVPEGVRFAVSDTGCGIPPEQRAHLFDRFRRPSGGKRAGTGLGLPIAHAIVQAHGGRIWAESEPGQGTTVCFTLPLAPQGAEGSMNEGCAAAAGP